MRIATRLAIILEACQRATPQRTRKAPTQRFFESIKRAKLATTLTGNDRGHHRLVGIGGMLACIRCGRRAKKTNYAYWSKHKCVQRREEDGTANSRRVAQQSPSPPQPDQQQCPAITDDTYTEHTSANTQQHHTATENSQCSTDRRHTDCIDISGNDATDATQDRHRLDADETTDLFHPDRDEDGVMKWLFGKDDTDDEPGINDGSQTVKVQTPLIDAKVENQRKRIGSASSFGAVAGLTTTIDDDDHNCPAMSNYSQTTTKRMCIRVDETHHGSLDMQCVVANHRKCNDGDNEARDATKL